MEKKDKEYRYVEILENKPLILKNDNDLLSIKNFLNSSSDLPIEIRDNLLIFDLYTVGSIRIGDLIISIKPRLDNFTVNDYFEMQLYSEGIINENVESTLNENPFFGIENNLTQAFLDSVEKITQSGLNGKYIDRTETSKFIRGRIKPEEITNLHLVYEKLPIEYQEFSLDVSYNKIIKLALDKINLLIEATEQKLQYSDIYKFFEDINADSSLLPTYIREIELDDYFSNEKYSTSLILAMRILDNLKINFQTSKGLNVKNYSYLINSNTVFEEYVRKVLSNHLTIPVSKWDRPKEIATIDVQQDEKIGKSIIPDILIDYSELNNSVYAVLDAKNKDISNKENLVNLADLYQIMFYSDNLDCRFSGLIYPNKIKNINSHGKVNIATNQNIDLYYFTLDFNKNLNDRHKQFVEEIKDIFQLT